MRALLRRIAQAAAALPGLKRAGLKVGAASPPLSLSPPLAQAKLDSAGFEDGAVVFPFRNYGDGSTTKSGLPFRTVSTGPAWLPAEHACKMGTREPFLLLPEVAPNPAAGLTGAT